MENNESPARPLNLSARPIERNVLKESNHIDGAIKSPKDSPLAGPTETHAKDNQLPVIQSSNRLSDGYDKVLVNKNLLRVATPTDTASSVSDDEEFLDCNTTFSSSIVNNTFDDAPIVSDQTFVDTEIDESPSVNASNGTHVPKKMNLGFIETGNSGVGNVSADKSMVLSTGEGECQSNDSKDSTISSSFIDNSQNNGRCNKSLEGISNESNDSSTEANVTVPLITVEGVSASPTETNEVAAVKLDQLFESKIESESPIQSEQFERHSIESTISVEPLDTVPRIEIQNPSEAIEVAVAPKSAIAIDSNTIINAESAIELASAIEMSPAIELEPAGESVNVSESEPVIGLTAAIETEPVIHAEPVIQADPIIEAEPVIEVEPVIEAEPPNESEPAIEAEPPNDSEPVIQAEPVIEAPSVIEAEPAIKSEPPIESEPVIQAEPVIEAQSVIEAEPVIESEPPIESEPVMQAETVIQAEPIIEAEPVIEAALVVETEPSIESDHVFQADLVVESALVIESLPEVQSEHAVKPTQVIESEPAIQNQPVIESEHADAIEPSNQSAPVNELKPAINVESSVETVPVIDSMIEEGGTDPNQSASISEPQSVIKTEAANESDSVVLTQSEPVESEVANESPLPTDTEAVVQQESAIESHLVTESEPIAETEMTQDGNALNVTCNVGGNSVYQPEATFIAGANEINQTVRIDSNSSKSDDELEAQASTTIPVESATFDGVQVTQANKIGESKANQSFSVDSLEQDTETQECSLDSLEMMEVDEPSTPTYFDGLSERLHRTATFDLPNAVGTNFEHPAVPNLNESNSSLTRKDTFLLQSPQNNNIPTISRQDTFSLLLLQNGNSSPPSTLPHRDSSSLTSDSSMDDITVLLNQVGINSPMTKVAGSSNRIQRNATYDTSNSDHVDQKSPTLADEPNAVVSKLQAAPEADSNAIVTNDDKIPVGSETPASQVSDSNANVVPNQNQLPVESQTQATPLTDSNTILADDDKLPVGTDIQATPLPDSNAIVVLDQDPLPEMVLSSNDFDFLQSRGAKKLVSEEDRRSSLLLRFDPLSGRTVQKLASTEEVVESSVATESGDANQTLNQTSLKDNISIEQQSSSSSSSSQAESSTANASEMSAVHDSKSIDNETNSFNSSIKADIAGGVPKSDKKIKFEHADENIRKKMEEYEATQDILVKRLTEKEKTLSKNCAIIEAYEKALAELVAEKEKITAHHEVANERLRQERDIHHQHLMSLEITFSDLHKKYERSKEIAIQLRERYDVMSEEKSVVDGLVKQQELRYEKMKQHALQQLEYANSTLEEQEKGSSLENSRLKALLKIEEVSRNTMQEQLLQKCKENKELVKICDELIGGEVKLLLTRVCWSLGS